MGPNIKTRIAGQKPPVFADKSAEFIHGEFGTLVTPRIRFIPRSMKNVEHEDRLGQTRYQGFKYRGITSGYAASNALLLKRKDRRKRMFNPFVFDEVRELVHYFLAILSSIDSRQTTISTVNPKNRSFLPLAPTFNPREIQKQRRMVMSGMCRKKTAFDRDRLAQQGAKLFVSFGFEHELNQGNISY